MARDDGGAIAKQFRRTFEAVKAKAGSGLGDIGTVALKAVLAQNRLNVSAEVHRGRWRLRWLYSSEAITKNAYGE